MATRYRGAMLLPYVSQSDLQALLSLGANLVRYQMTDASAGSLTSDGYRTWIRTHLDHIESILPLVRQYDAKLIIDLHTPPGGIDTSGVLPLARMWSDRPWALDTMKTVWAEIAARFKDTAGLIGFDIMNEPAGPGGKVMKLYSDCLKVIRSITHDKVCIVSTPYGDPARVSDFIKFPYKYVWYTVHFYSPLQMTHQGVYPEFPAPKVYPNEHTNRERMVRDLKAIKEFKRRFRVPVYIGEYAISALADEDSRVRWYKDATELFDQYGFENSYHAWREDEKYWSIEVHPKVFGFFKNYWKKNA